MAANSLTDPSAEADPSAAGEPSKEADPANSQPEEDDPASNQAPASTEADASATDAQMEEALAAYEAGTLGLKEQVALAQQLSVGVSTMALPDGYSGIGSESMPLRIGNVEVLAQLSQFVREDTEMDNDVYFADMYYELASDIDLGSFGGWTPIGTKDDTSTTNVNEDRPFTGTFDGKGMAILNMTVASGSLGGLFGNTTGTIKNLGVTNATVTSTTGSAGIIAGSASGTIEQCYTTGTVSGADKSGGIVGEAAGALAIQNCYSTATVTGVSRAGGIVGKGGNVSNCYATGNVEASGVSSQAGGIVGEATSVTNCVALNEKVSATGTASQIGFIGDGNFAWTGMKQKTDPTDKPETTVTKDCTAISSPLGKTLEPNPWSNFDSGVWKTSDSTLAILQGANGAQSSALPSWILPKPTGSEELPFKISTVADLEELCKLVNGDIDSSETDFTNTSGSHYILTNDIDLKYYEDSGDSDTDSDSWQPIGNYNPSNYINSSFKGQFDGQGYAITNMIADMGVGYGAGLFGKTEPDSTIKNLGVTEASITQGRSHVGDINSNYDSTDVAGLIVANNEGTISNCYSSGIIGPETGVSSSADGWGFVIGGGIAGTSKGMISNCYSSATVASVTAGGIVGETNSVVSNCYTTGNVLASDTYDTNGNPQPAQPPRQAGGIVGHLKGSATVTDCYVTGTVTAKKAPAGSSGTDAGAGSIMGLGGIVGSSESNATSPITNCVVLSKNITAASGWNVSKIAVTKSGSDFTTGNNYAWDGITLTGTTNNNDQVNDLTCTDSVLNKQFSGIFTSQPSAWTFTENGLPTLNGVGGIQLSTLPVWIATDTTLGSAENPFVITTVEQLNELGLVVNGYGNRDPSGSEYVPPDYISPYGYTNTEDSYYVLGNDIDMASVENWTPIGDNGTYHVFRGHFDGKGHLIKNLTMVGEGGPGGLFGSATSGSSITNLGMENVNINLPKAKVVGAVIAYTEGSVSKCFSSGSITGDQYVGGLVGRTGITGKSTEPDASTISVGGTISDCYSTANVTGSPINSAYVGGIVGEAVQAQVLRCYATGTIRAEYDGADQQGGAGGIVGSAMYGDSAGGMVEHTCTTVADYVALNVLVSAKQAQVIYEMPGEPAYYAVNRVVGNDRSSDWIPFKAYAWSGMTVTSPNEEGPALNGTISNADGLDLFFSSSNPSGFLMTGSTLTDFSWTDLVSFDADTWVLPASGSNELPTLKVFQEAKTNIVAPSMPLKATQGNAVNVTDNDTRPGEGARVMAAGDSSFSVNDKEVATGGLAQVGDTVTIVPADATRNYMVDNYTSDDVTIAADGTFVMPDRAITVKVNYTNKPHPTKLDITSLVAAPEKLGSTEDIPIVFSDTVNADFKDQYTEGKITWYEEDGYTPVETDIFLGSTTYVAKVTLAATDNLTFANMPENQFKHTGAVTGGVTNGKGTDYFIDVYVKFPATVAPEVKGMTVTENPTKTTYNMNEQFDPAGMELSDKHDDGTTKPIFTSDWYKAGYTFRPTAMAANTTEVTITDKAHANDSAYTDTVGVTVRENLASFTNPADVNASWNAEKTEAGLNLPATVPVTTTKGTTGQTAPVSWKVNECSYIKGQLTEQKFTVTGTLDLTTADMSNVNNVSTEVSVNVTVAAAPAVDAFDLASLVAAPTKNGIPGGNFDATKGGQYAGTVTWKTTDGADLTGNKFLGGTSYTAMVVLTTTDHSFETLKANVFKYSGLEGVTVTNAAGSHDTPGTMTVTIEFPATEPRRASTITATQPTKTEYKLGEFLDLTGSTVSVVYDDDTTGTINASTPGVTINPAKMEGNTTQAFVCFDGKQSNAISVTVLENLTSIAAFAPVANVPNGTAKDDAHLGASLPKQATVTTSKGTQVKMDVAWDIAGSSYDPDLLTEQTFTVQETIDLAAAGITNVNNVSTTVGVTVTVLEAEVVVPEPPSTEPDSKDTEERITGIAPGETDTVGTEYNITVDEYYRGDMSYRPVHWSTNPEGDFEYDPVSNTYRAKIDTTNMTLGAHELTITYREVETATGQVTGKVAQTVVPYTLEPKPEPVSPSGGDTGGTGDTGTGSQCVKTLAATGDTTLPFAATAGFLALASALTAGFVLLRRKH